MLPVDPEQSAEDTDDGYDGEMTWEEKAREAIQDAIGNVEFDEVRGALYLMSEHDHRWNSVKEEFRDVQKLRTRLTEIGEGEWVDYVPFDSGEPVFEPNVEAWVEDALTDNGIEEFFFRIANRAEFEDEDEENGVEEELVLASELLAVGAGLVVQVDVSEINAELVEYLAKHPEKMREMNPRKFEELVAELFKDMGYEVEVTPRSNDGGLDIRVIHKSGLGRFLTLIECKRYSAENKVDVGIVRGLSGVVSAENATSGLIATTSYFTKGAKSFQRRIEARMALADFEELRKLLGAYRKRPKS